jgi:hypothetical protein
VPLHGTSHALAVDIQKIVFGPSTSPTLRPARRRVFRRPPAAIALHGLPELDDTELAGLRAVLHDELARLRELYGTLATIQARRQGRPDSSA